MGGKIEEEKSIVKGSGEELFQFKPSSLSQKLPLPGETPSAGGPIKECLYTAQCGVRFFLKWLDQIQQAVMVQCLSPPKTLAL